MVQLSIVIPAYNEEKRLGPTLKEYAEYAQKRGNTEIIVLINGSKDKTEEIAKEIEKTYKEVRHKTYENKLGKGGAVYSGFNIAEGNMIGFSDSDNSTTPQEFDKLVKALENDSTIKGAIASRRMPESIVPQKQPFLRPYLGFAFNRFVRAVFRIPYKDTQCGAKLFQAEQLREITPEFMIRDFAFDIELLYLFHRKGYKIKEVPITWNDKAGSTVNLSKTCWNMFKSTFKLRIAHSPFRRFVNKNKYTID